jgi:hypothetical protein
MTQEREAKMPTSDGKIVTIGEYRVGISFNPGGHELVNKIKRAAADLIDLVDGIQASEAEVVRLKHLAMTHIEDAAMWAVKAATKPPLGT